MTTPTHRLLTMTGLAVVVVLPLLGLSGVASATTHAAGPKVCVKHPNRAKCTPAGGGATGSGTGGAPAPITIQIDPKPVTETGTSDVFVVVQVETSASFAGDPVDVSSSQLDASCTGQVGYANPAITFSTSGPGRRPLHAPLVLDDDGNATVIVFGTDCAPGSSVIEASLGVAPFLTALGTLMVSPPAVTPTGVFGAPTTSGTVTTGEVETGDTPASGDSDVYAVFNVETDPVYAEQTVEISSSQLDSRCIVANSWIIITENGIASFGSTTVQAPVSTALDDDGNATFLFIGQSCAAGSSEVVADVMAGTHPTYTTSFTVDPPALTI